MWKIADIESGSVSYKGLDFSDTANQVLKSLLNLTEGNRFVFTKDGDFLIASASKESVGFGIMTYEKQDKETLTIQFAVSTILGEVKTKYSCEYRFEDKNTLILNFEDTEITLKRDKEGKPKEYLEAAEEFHNQMKANGDEIRNELQGYGEEIRDYGEKAKESIEEGLGIDLDKAGENLTNEIKNGWDSLWGR